MKGSVIIKKEQEPNGVMYYMKGKHDVLTNWDMKLEKVKEFLFALFITLGLPYMLLVLAYVLG